MRNINRTFTVDMTFLTDDPELLKILDELCRSATYPRWRPTENDGSIVHSLRILPGLPE